MDLEQRVNLLEQEVKLLKTEVQATLLDIQEQLLSTHFSDLRAETAGEPQMRGAVAISPDFDKQSETSTPPANLKVIALEVEAAPMPSALAKQQDFAGDERLDLDEPQPAASLQESSQDRQPAKSAAAPATALGQNGNHKPEVQPKVAEKTSPDSNRDWETLRLQTDWTIQTVRRFGPERTCQLIEVYTRSGFLSTSAGAVLKRVAGAFQPVAAPAQNMKGAEKVARAPAETIGELDQVQKRDIIRRIINRLQKVGSRQDTSHG